MKKVLVLASLGLLTLSFSCGGGSNGEKAADVETAAGMSSAIIEGAGDGLLVDTSIKTNELIDTIPCIPAGEIAVDLDVVSSTSGKLTLTYDKCGFILCNDYHVFMDGNLEETYEVSSSEYLYEVDGTLSFVEGPAGFEKENVDTLYIGSTCTIDISININIDDLASLVTEEAIVEYVNTHTNGTVCGYDWEEAVDIDVDDLSGTYCTSLTI